MSQIGSVNVNFNYPNSQSNYLDLTKVFVAGVSQRGPIYKVVEITTIEQFIIVFGQPTNEYEFDFFQAMKSTVDNGGVALCYRIPYTDDKNLDAVSLDYYIVKNLHYGKIDSDEEGDFDIAFYDPITEKYYYMVADDAPKNATYKYVLKIDPVENPTYFVNDIVIKSNNTFYRVYVEDEQVFAVEVGDESVDNVYNQFYIRHINETEYNFCIDIYANETEYGFGLYLKQASPVDEWVSDVKYVSNSEMEIDHYQAKLSFTPINDFNSVLEFTTKNDVTEISAAEICYDVKSDINPSQIIGVFPILFAAKDAENVRNFNFEEVYPYNSKTENYIDAFNVYPCNGTGPHRLASQTLFNDVFNEFEKSTHFKKNWLEIELSKLIDEYVPQNINECKNTMGVAFMAYYLDDEHKLDYKILESYYGLIGCSDKRFEDLEDLVNKNSNFFRLEIDGAIEKTQYLRALNGLASNLESGDFIVPMISPAAPIEKHLIDTESIFADKPSVKYPDPDENKPTFKQSLSMLLKKFIKTEYFNSVPFDFIVMPGIADILLLSTESSITNKFDSLVPYLQYEVNLDNAKSIDLLLPNEQYVNVKSLYRMMSYGTTIGDKGCISIIDIPFTFNEYLSKNTHKWSSEKDIKENLRVLNNIIENTVSYKDIYNRTYPIFNYQRVDKDSRLTRYKIHRPLRKFELVPGSAMMVGAYVNEDMNDNFDPVAGPRSMWLFVPCHKCFVEMENPNLFKILFDMFGVSSLINDRDNNTFPVQQTTWRNSTSVLKQLHAFRIYVEIRRRAINILRRYLYEPNIETIRSNIQTALSSMIYEFKKNNYIDDNSNARVWADISDIEQHQLQVVITIGIFGAIVKIIVNMNLQSMTIEVSQ